MPAEDAVFVNERIRDRYAVNWLIDGLPAGMLSVRQTYDEADLLTAKAKVDADQGTVFYSVGMCVCLQG
jgi:hypothetical protein